MAVYFLRPVGQRGPIKIGYSQNVDTRLLQYAMWSPVPLELIGTFDGSRVLEGRIHQYLIDHRLHHEWFEATEWVCSVVDQLIAGTFDLSALPEKGIGYKGRRAHLAWPSGRSA